MYDYPIHINRGKEEIQSNSAINLGNDVLTIKDLEFVGDNEFCITDFDGRGYEVTVFYYRLETDEEQEKRIAKEEAYMKEYERRNKNETNIKKIRQPI